MIRRIRIVLRLHAKAVAKLIRPAALAGDGAVQKIADLKLQAGFSRKHFQHAAYLRLVNRRHQSKLAERFVDDPIVVVAVAKFDLFIIRADPRADGRGRAKIERRAVHRPPKSAPRKKGGHSRARWNLFYRRQ